MNGHEVALWSAVAAACGYLLAVGVFDVLDPQAWVEYLGAILVAVVTGATVYAQQRLKDAKTQQKGERE